MTRQIRVERLTVVSSQPFDKVVAAFESALDHPDMSTFQKEMAAAANYGAMEAFIQRSAEKSGFLQLARFDLGAVLRKEQGPAAPKTVRYLIGNPLIMKEMVKHVPDAGSYAPVTVLIDERRDGVHLTYDTMASFLESYGSTEALAVARDLDAKVEGLLREASGD